MARSQMRESPKSNIQGFEFLVDDTLMFAPSQIFFQKAQAAALRACEFLETHTVLPVKGTFCAEPDSEPVSD